MQLGSHLVQFATKLELLFYLITYFMECFIKLLFAVLIRNAVWFSLKAYFMGHHSAPPLTSCSTTTQR